MRRIQRFLVVAVVATLGAALVAGAAFAAPGDPPESKTLVQHLLHEIERVRLQLVNSGARMRGGAVSMGQPSGDRPLTPALRCCDQNITRIQEHLGEMSSIWGELVGCYREQEDAEAEIQANFVREDAASLIRALSVFAESPTEDGSVGGHQAMIRAYKQVLESAEKLVECGEPRVRVALQ
jgi:hypothetical protein